jgi:hypothetical protein
VGVNTDPCEQRPRPRNPAVNPRLKGKLPATPTTAKVLTDTNCAADRNGISHCSNILRLASGRAITVRHDHSMMNDPCVSPGERVLIRPLR